MVKTVQVSDEFHNAIQTHGVWGEKMEDILLRLLGNKIKIPTSNKPTKVHDNDDVDSKKTKIKRHITSTEGKNE